MKVLAITAYCVPAVLLFGLMMLGRKDDFITSGYHVQKRPLPGYLVEAIGLCIVWPTVLGYLFFKTAYKLKL